MLLGDILIAKGLVGGDDIDRAIARQKREGGRLGDNLVALGAITEEALKAVLLSAPVSPNTVEETGIDAADLLKLMVKTMYAENLETPGRISDSLKLPFQVVSRLLDEAKERKLTEPLTSVGGAGGGIGGARFTLTAAGRTYALDALEQSQYTGAAPVSLEALTERVLLQRITNERIDREDIRRKFSDLIVTDEFVRQLGPALNSGRTLLLYGPAGNGKTSIAERIGAIFHDIVYIPYAVQVEGQIIKVYDEGVHQSVEQDDSAEPPATLRREKIDLRWMPCLRPLVISGGELSLELLDLQYNEAAKFYEAPLHMKALNGTFVIDDFGRQIVSPEDLLNRWIVPLQSRVDYLKLHTGKSFQIPFDELVIFSTNLQPADLMDPAFLRRIPYKLPTEAPSRADLRRIFEMVAGNAGLEIDDDIFELVIEHLRVLNDFPLACYQPKFIVDQVIDACKYDGVAPQITPELVVQAIDNLYTKDTPGYGVPGSPDDSVVGAGFTTLAKGAGGTDSAQPAQIR
jgi:hypothetical protein